MPATSNTVTPARGPFAMSFVSLPWPAWRAQPTLETRHYRIDGGSEAAP
jgi:hypothetical protein